MAITTYDLTALEVACGQIHDFYFSNYDKYKYHSGIAYGYPEYDQFDQSYRASSQMTYSQAKVSRKAIKFNNTGDRLYFVLVPSNYPDSCVDTNGNVYRGIRHGGLSAIYEYQYLPGAVSLTTPWDITTIDLSTLHVYRPGSSLYDAYVNTDRSTGILMLSPSDDGNLMRTITGLYETPNDYGGSSVDRGVMGITSADPSTEPFGWNQFNTILTTDTFGGFGTIPPSTTIVTIYDMYIAPTAPDEASAYEVRYITDKYNKIFVAAQTRYLSAFSGYLNTSEISLYEITDRHSTGYNSDWYLNGGTGYPSKIYQGLGSVSNAEGHFAFSNNGMRLFIPYGILDLQSPYAVHGYEFNTVESYDGNGGYPSQLEDNYDQGFTVSPDGSTIFFFENTDVENNHGTLYACTRDPIFVPDPGGGSIVSGPSGNTSNFGFQVFDANGVKRFDSLDVTWNQVGFFRVNAGVDSSFNIPNIAGKAVAVGQIMVNPSLFTRKTIAAEVTVFATEITVSGHTEDIYVLVLVKG